MNSLRKAKAFLAKKSSFENEPSFYVRYVQLLETMILETGREMERIIPLLEAEKSLLQSKKFKNFPNSDLKDPKQRAEYEEYIHLFDQERDIYKLLSHAIEPKLHQYNELSAQIVMHIKALEEAHKEKLSNLGSKVGAIGITLVSIGAAVCFILKFLSSNPSESIWSLDNLLAVIALTTSGSLFIGGIFGGLGGLAVGEWIKSLKESLNSSIQVDQSFD